jgi:alkyl hydroperoxide reductase subunit D
MSALDTLREQLPDAAKDIRLNLQSVLQQSSLTPTQKWGVAIACAFAARNPELKAAVIEAAGQEIEPNVLDDAKAAATLMGMNNVYYRFRHMIGKETYSTKPARLRMNRLVQVATNKTDFELMCLAVSAINGCEMCVQSHEKVVLEGGLTEDQVHDAVRIAATLHAAAVALELA